MNFVDAYQRRDNLRLYNIPEKYNENVEQVVRTFMREKLELDARNIDISIAHRLGARENNDKNRTRCIIVRFVRRSDINKVKAATRKLQGTRYGVSDDLPASWATARSRAYKQHVKPAKENKQKVRWRGDRLFIDGKEVRLDRSGFTPGPDHHLTDTNTVSLPQRTPRTPRSRPHTTRNTVNGNAPTRSTESQSPPSSPVSVRGRDHHSPSTSSHASLSEGSVSNTTLTQSLQDRLDQFQYRDSANDTDRAGPSNSTRRQSKTTKTKAGQD